MYIHLGLGILFIVNMLSASCHDERQKKVFPLLPFLSCANNGGLGYGDVKKQGNQHIIHRNQVFRVALRWFLLKHYGIIGDYEVKTIFSDLILDEEESCDKGDYFITEYGPISVEIVGNEPLGVGRIRFPVVLGDKELEASLNALPKDLVYPSLVLKCSPSLDSLKWPGGWKEFFCAVDKAWNNSATKSMVFDDFMMKILSFWVRGSDVQLNGDCAQAVVMFCHGYGPVDFCSWYENIQ